jgi:N-6 DNA Methylase
LGHRFSDEDDLFVNHTLLVVMAEIIAHCVVGFDPTDPTVSAQTITSGALFSTSAQIGGVVEADFFDWITEVKGGGRSVKALARRLARFAWHQVQHDVMKVLYESVISTETRKKLGEYYTPDWLANRIVDQVVTSPLAEKVLDPACGSGTFLFAAIRHYIAAAFEAGHTNSEVVSGVVSHVMGIDVHPVAVNRDS